MPANHPPLNLYTQYCYSVQISGILGPDSYDELGETWQVSVLNNGNSPYSILIGQKIDQAALVGLLKYIYFRGYPLISVNLTPSMT